MATGLEGTERGNGPFPPDVDRQQDKTEDDR